MRADLHVHSTASDGVLTPTALVQAAVDARLDVLAIADHDSVDGLTEALAAAPDSLRIIPAVELSSITDDGRDLHILGYFVDASHPTLLRDLSSLRKARLQRATMMTDALDASGLTVDFDEVMRISNGGAVGRVHIARALVAAGHAESIADAFARLIGRDSPFYLHKARRSPAEAIRTIRCAGGIAVLAHPGISEADDVIDDLVTHGLCGIEAFHGDHTEAQRLHYAHRAGQLGLLVTGGSDFHSPDGPNPSLGGVDIPADCIEAFLDAGDRRVART